MSPYVIDGPAMISFSGGRTSGYLLHQVLRAGLRPDVHVLFANTGKERPETLDFVHQVSENWGVNVRWLERGREEVSYSTASRNGEPFAALLKERGYLPTSRMRFCTSELKIRVMKGFMLRQGYDRWTNVVGLRWDEPSRVARMQVPNRERWETDLPLNAAKVTLQTVTDFWNAHPFDLQLLPHEGNCDLCFLKGQRKRLSLMRSHPELAAWWVGQEARAGQAFRRDVYTYQALLDQVRRSPTLWETRGADPTDLGDCVCHD